MEFFNSINHLAETEYLYIGSVVLVLALLLFLLVRRQPKNVMAYSTANGQVMVGRSAIIELVQTSCEQISEVSKPQVSVNAKSNKTHFEVRLKLASGAHLRSIEETLQAHLRKALSENLGIENLGRINIVATGFKSGRIEQSSALKKKDPAIEDSITEPEELSLDETEPTEPENGQSKIL
ncbi:MAG: alkaline shock response membrane anchor protein AmaP [Verrucomicrobiota bacterium]